MPENSTSTEPEPQRSRLRSFVANALLLIGALLIAVLLGEVIVRALYQNEMVLYPRYHTDYQYGEFTLRGTRPNSVFRHTSVDGSWKFITNNAGLRNEQDFPYEKPPGVVRVLSLGDSQTQGHEVRQEATYSAVLERALGARGTPAQVLNAGVSGFSTAESLIYLENEGYRYDPDVVVLGFFANDFEDNFKADLFRLDDAQHLTVNKYAHIPGVRIQNAIYTIPLVRWLGEHSYVYSLAFNTTWSFFKTRLQQEAQQRTRAAGTDTADTAAAAGAQPGQVEFALPTRAYTPAEEALAVALIERMQAFCESRGIRLVVVDIPTRIDDYRTGPSLPSSALTALDSAGVEYITHDALLGDFDGGPYFHVPHGYHHISEFTHALIGTALARLIAAPTRPTTS